MQVEDVTAFLQIASTGSLSAAARASGKPKATISHQLRRLEDELGVELFVRSTNRLVLSEAGVNFLDHGKNIRRAFERGLDAARSSRNVAIGTIRVASAGEFTSNLVAPLVLHFARNHPNLRLEVVVLRGEALKASTASSISASRRCRRSPNSPPAYSAASPSAFMQVRAICAAGACRRRPPACVRTT